MLLDWKYPKFLEPVVSEIQRAYWSSNTRKTKTSVNRAIGCIVYNTYYMIKMDRTTLFLTLNSNDYSKDLVYNGVKVKRKVSYRALKDVLTWMERNQYLTITKGCFIDCGAIQDGSRGFKRTLSTATIHNKLSGGIKPYIKTKNKRGVTPNVVEVRDTEGKPITKKMGDYQQKVIEVLGKYNSISVDSNIELDGKQYLVQLKKVYKMRFTEGGRNYAHIDPLVYSELFRRDNRDRIRIGGEDTVELDYEALHPRILAEMAGVVLREGFDPYQIEIPGYSERGARCVGKYAMLIGINAGFGRRGIGALIKTLKDCSRVKELKKLGEIPNIIEHRFVMDTILSKNPYISHYTDQNLGLKLQNLDSRMMDIIIEQLNSIEEVGVPFHDSMVVKGSLKDFTYNTMKDAYKHVLGSGNNCVIRVK